jgi:hypothetical protein
MLKNYLIGSPILKDNSLFEYYIGNKLGIYYALFYKGEFYCFAMKQKDFKDIIKIEWKSWEEIKQDLIKNKFKDKDEKRK